MVFDLMLFDNNGWGNQFEKNVNVWLLKWFFSKKKKKKLLKWLLKIIMDKITNSLKER